MTRTRRHLARPGMTFLEVVLAVALLGAIASTMFGAFEFLFRADARERHQLASAELAHRLMLQFLDDEESMPAPNLPVPYGPADNESLYRWSLERYQLRYEESVAVQEAQSNSRRTRTSPTDTRENLQQIVITVWLAEDSGGSTEPMPGTPMARIVRLYDPMFIMRNPDSADYLIQDPERLIRQITNGGAGAQPMPDALPDTGESGDSARSRDRR
ncbi:MAG: hypothetical protein KDA28_06090 [Phycisphaerales bacterium]|nr:hypothetical protein [Phycisphaerales bacterium]